MKNDLLKDYFLTSILQHKSDDLSFFRNMCIKIVKTNKEEPKLDFLFDIFSAFQAEIKGKQIREFIQIFELSPEHFKGASSLSKADFIGQTTLCDLNFKLYEDAKFAIIGMVGLVPANIEEERDSILAVLDQNRNMESAINNTLQKEDASYYILEKEFWDSWTDNVSFRGNQSSFDIRKEKKLTIDNQALLEEGHEYRIREVSYNEEYIIVPKLVFRSLSRWYSCNKVIERMVLKQNI